jgi:recombination protein RecT
MPKQLQQKLSQYLSHPARRDLITAVLPAGFETKRILAIAISSALDDPKLESCDPKSVFASIVQAARMGLEVGGLAGEAYLIPYKQICTLQCGYKGWHKLVRGPQVRQIHAGVARENDTEWEYFESPIMVKHRPLIAETKERGKVVCAYAVAYDHDLRIFDATWVTPAEITKAEKLSVSKNTGLPSPAWRDWHDEMAKKTAIKRLAKNLPLLHQHAAQMTAIESAPGEHYDADIIETAERLDAAPNETPAIPEAGTSSLRKPKVVEADAPL